MGDFSIFGQKMVKMRITDFQRIVFYAEMMRRNLVPPTSNHGTPDKGGSYWWVEPDSIFVDHKNFVILQKLCVLDQREASTPILTR